MAPPTESKRGDHPTETTLYLESADLDPTDAFCTEVFENADKGEYRVVQLTATRSFESLSDALNVQLEHIRNPSEAAVIITTPQDDEKSTSTEVDGTVLHGFRVNPEDLTGISIAFSRLIDNWEETEGTVKICLRDIESLLPYHDSDLIYRFLNTVLATLQGTGADVHAHFAPEATDEQTLQMFKSLFDKVVNEDVSKLKTVQETASESRAEQSAGTPEAIRGGPETDSTDSDEVTATTMSDEAVDSFLQSEGYGILAFDGDSPYAIPMSYGYDSNERVLYVHLANYEGSEKQRRLNESNRVVLVVSQYERPDQWQSVVVDGTLSQLSNNDVRERNVFEAFASSELASVDVFNRDLAEISFEWYILEPSRIEGREGSGVN